MPDALPTVTERSSLNPAELFVNATTAVWVAPLSPQADLALAG